MKANHQPFDTDKLIRLGPILEILQAVIWTGRLSGEAPVSACLVASPQSAKSECLKYFRSTPTLKIFSDLTSRGVLDQIRLIEAKQLRHIVLMDLHMIVSHNRYTADRTLLTLGALMEEGLGAVADAGGELRLRDLPKIGVLMGVTPEYYVARRGYWRRTGFLSRFLTIWYEYSDDTKVRIHEAISRGTPLPDPRNEKLPQDNQLVTIRDEEARIIMEYALSWGASHPNDPGYRLHKQLRKLVMARALIHGRNITCQEDAVKVLTWTKFFHGTPVPL